MKNYVVVFRTYGKNIETDIYQAKDEKDAERLFEEDCKVNKWGYHLLGAIEYAED